MSKSTEQSGSRKKFDCHAFVMHCKKHDKVLVHKSHEGLWIPFRPTRANRSLHEGALEGALSILSGGTMEVFQEVPPFDRMSSMQVFRIQLPQTQRFVTRLIYYFSVVDTPHYKCCKQLGPEYEWFDLKQVKEGRVDNLRGPELVELCNAIGDKIAEKIEEYSLEEALLYVPRDPPRNLEEDMLKALRVTEKDIERFYADFIEHCYPSFYQTYDSFKRYMAKYDFEKDEARCRKLFKAIAYKKKGYISFHEFLLGLACLEPTIQHGEYRVKFIFRYYDADENGHLSEDEFRDLIADMSNRKEDSDNRMREALKLFKTVQLDGKTQIPASNFINAIGAHSFRGTSVLCRSTKPIFNQITKALVSKAIYTPTQNQRLKFIIPDTSKTSKGKL